VKSATNIPLYCSFYPRFCEIGRSLGYAICVHGSLENDLDLLAVPWIESPSDPVDLVTAIAKAVEGAMPFGAAMTGEGKFVERDLRVPKQKPHGRYVWTILLQGGLFIDFGVIPPGDWWPKSADNVPRHVQEWH